MHVPGDMVAHGSHVPGDMVAHSNCGHGVMHVYVKYEL